MIICEGIVPNCCNPDSYNCICVRCNQCGRFNKPAPQPPKQTRYDKIMRDMTVEKLAELLTEYSAGDGDYWYENDAGKWNERSSAVYAEIAWLNEVDK